MTKENLGSGFRMAIGTVYIFLAESLILPTGFITAVFLTRSLGPAHYGIFVVVSRLINWIELVSTSVFSSTTVRFIAEESDWQALATTIVRLHLIMGCGIAALLWILSSPISAMFDEPALCAYLRLFAIDIPIFNLACANSNILIGLGRFKERARIRTIRWISRMILIILFVEAGLSVTGAIMGSIGASVLELGASLFYIRVPLFSKIAFPPSRLRGVAAPLFMSALSLRIFKTDLFLLKILGGSAASAGFYGASLNLTRPFALVSESLTPALLATLTRLLSEKEISRAREIGKIIVCAPLRLAPFAAMTAGSACEIVRFVFGEAFAPAGPILGLLIFSIICLFILKISNAIFTALRKPRVPFMITGPMVPMALIGHLILIPRMGAVGAALVTTLTAALGAMVSVFLLYRIWGISPRFRTLLNMILCSSIAWVLTVIWPTSGLILILKLAVISLMILLLFFILREFDSYEIKLIRENMRRRE